MVSSPSHRRPPASHPAVLGQCAVMCWAVPRSSSVQFQLCGLEMAPISPDGRAASLAPAACFEREAGEVAYPFFAGRKWRRKWFVCRTDGGLSAEWEGGSALQKKSRRRNALS